MQRVIDASVVAKWFLPEAHKEKAEQILRDFLDDKTDLIVPDLIISEVGNVVWKRSAQRKEISTTEAEQIYANFLALNLPLNHSPGMATAALKLSLEQNHPIYDMLHRALAELTTCES
jgi:predicted nucleic acid-binding protein